MRSDFKESLNHKQPSEIFIYDPLDFLAIWNYQNWDNEIRFQSELNSFKKSDFFPEIMKFRGIEVIKPIVSR